MLLIWGLIMRRLQCALLVTVAAIGFASVASAADMPVKAPVLKAPAGYTAIDWSGFYFGGHVGYGMSEMRGTYDEVGDHGGLDIPVRGLLGGAQAGYNWQFGRSVYGVEIDGTWADLTGSRVDRDGDTQRFRTSFLGSARVRAGLAIENMLLYSTFGLGYSRAKFTVTGSDTPSPAEQSLNRWGYVTGFGAEWAIAPHWSVRGEYLYYGFNHRVDTPTLTNDSDARDYVKHDGTHVARIAVNYRFNPSGPVANTSAPVANWAGLYLGAHAGYGRSNMLGDYDEIGDHGSFDFDPRGFVGGGQIGYNWQSGAWVYGIEADGTWSGMKNSRIDGDLDSQELRTTTMASLRARVGVAADNKLLYLTGGLGYVGSKLNVVEGGVPATQSINSWGPVVGAGTEWRFGSNWSARIEGLTYLVDKRVNMPTLTVDSDANDFLRQRTVSVVRIGLNYHFNPTAGVARY